MRLGIDAAQVAGLAADLAGAGPKASRYADQAIRKAGMDVQRQAQAACPVRTGNLRSSISTTTGWMWAEVGPTASYGAYVELGTSRMRPQPYMQPAADQVLPQLDQALAQIGGQVL